MPSNSNNIPNKNLNQPEKSGVASPAAKPAGKDMDRDLKNKDAFQKDQKTTAR
jgi:hypothetical protein